MFTGMRVYVRLAPHLRGRVGGLCGNFDGDTENDFTTRQGIVESTAEIFGNSWKLSPSCPDVADQDLRDPCAVSHVVTCCLVLLLLANKSTEYLLCLDQPA